MKRIFRFMFLISIFIIISISVNYSMAMAATIKASNQKVELKEGENKFTLDILIDNEGKDFSGGEFGLKLQGTKLQSVDYKIKNASWAGPIERDGITYIGFFNKDNIFKEGNIATLTFTYEGNAEGTVEVVDSQVTTRVDKFSINSDKKVNGEKVSIVRKGHDGEVSSEIPKEHNNEIQFAPTDKLHKEDIINAISNGYNDVVINLLKPQIIDSEIFKAIKGKNSNLIINLLNDNKSVLISWIFNGKDILYDNIPFNADIDSSIDDEIKGKTLKSPLQCLTLLHNGYLPGKCKVTYELSDDFSNEDKVNVFYYDGKVKEVTRGIDLLNSKTISFYINAGGKYFITTATMDKVDKKDSNGDVALDSSINKNKTNNIWMYTSLILIITTIMLGVLVVIQNRKIKELKVKCDKEP